jgi:rod shape-determining protein MreC
VLKPNRVFFAAAVFLLALAAVPLPQTAGIRSFVTSLLKTPILLSKTAAQTAADLVRFRENAAENRRLTEALGRARTTEFRAREAFLENERLTRILGLKQAVPPPLKRAVTARVIGRSPSTWNRVLLIDKGTRDGIHVNMPVLSGLSLAGKIIESGPTASKVLLVSDPNSRVGVMLQSSRHQGILYGVFSGGCRMKYIPVSAAVAPGDTVETAGFGGFFPKGLAVGTVRRVWKEPGQIYQVADVDPLADLARLEEVLCVE